MSQETTIQVDVGNNLVMPAGSNVTVQQDASSANQLIRKSQMDAADSAEATARASADTSLQAQITALGGADVSVSVAALNGTSIGTYTGTGAGPLNWTAAPALIDGVAPSVGMKFLLNGGGTTPLDNGVWTITTWTATGAAMQATRTTGFTTGATLRDARVRVLSGRRKGATYVNAHPVARTIADATLGRIWFKRVDSQCGPDEAIRWSEDFTTSIATGVGFNPATSIAGGYLTEATSGGAGAFCTIDLTAAGLQAGNQRGIHLYRTGTLNTGWAAIAGGWGLSTTIADIGDSLTLSTDAGFTRRWKVTIRQLSTGTQEYAAFAALASDRVAQQKSFASGIGWIYDRTSAVSTVNWLRAVRNGGSGTPVDSGITAAVGAWHEFRIDKYAGDDAVYLYEDGVLVQTVTTGLPTVGIATLVGSFASVGTTDKAGLAIDWDIGEIVTPAGRG